MKTMHVHLYDKQSAISDQLSAEDEQPATINDQP
jgi:hypothetical protein